MSQSEDMEILATVKRSLWFSDAGGLLDRRSDRRSVSAYRSGSQELAGPTRAVGRDRIQ
jgi:hypothetical protein